MTPLMISTQNRWLYRFSLFLTTLTLCLILAGGLVTSHEAGLAVPDWPMSYGQWMPPLVGNIFWEHGHRMIAGAVGILTLIFAIWIQIQDPRSWMKKLGWVAFGAVVLQAILGGLTVKFLLPAPLSIFHACLAQTFFCLIAAMLYFLSSRFQETLPSSVGTTGRSSLLFTITAALVYLQLILGATVRHTGHGIVFHILDAFLVLGSILLVVGRVSHHYQADILMKRLAGVLGFGALLQFSLGLGAFIFTRVLSRGYAPSVGEVAITAVHQTLGAVILMVSVLMTLIANTPSPQPSPPLGGEGNTPKQGVRGKPTPNLLNKVIDYLELTKMRLVSLTLWSTAAGFLLANPGPLNKARLFLTLAGAGLVAAGSMSLNEWLERHEDAKMSRTAKRPLPAGRLHPQTALFLGITLALAGCLLLLIKINALSAVLAALTLISYIFIYTPLKKRTELNTLVGAIPGALPPMIGWAAVHEALPWGAWSLFWIIFFWQMPHFYAISWFCRKDYAAAGFKMLSVEDASGKKVGKHIFLYTLAIILVTLLPFWAGMAGPVYGMAALALGTVLAVLGYLAMKNLDRYARVFFRASLLYLTLLFIFMVFDKQ